jgi:tellurium resistance protein TerD
MSNGSNWLPPGARPPSKKDKSITEDNAKKTVTRMKTASHEGSAPVTCPECGSEQITTNKKGFGVGKAVAGGVLAGGVGLLAGFFGSRKIQVTCLKCSHSWIAGKE